MPAFAGVTSSITPARYIPSAVATRAQTATFVARLIDTAVSLHPSTTLEPLPAYDGTNSFADVADDDVHVGNINRLADAGVILGGPGDRTAASFAPGRTVTRAQMASLVTRSLGHLTGTPVVSANDCFVDDDASVHEGNINALAESGIVVGDGINRFGPDRSVNRAQMAAFLTRSLATLERDGVVRRCPTGPAPCSPSSPTILGWSIPSQPPRDTSGSPSGGSHPA